MACTAASTAHPSPEQRRRRRSARCGGNTAASSMVSTAVEAGPCPRPLGIRSLYARRRTGCSCHSRNADQTTRTPPPGGGRPRPMAGPKAPKPGAATRALGRWTTELLDDGALAKRFLDASRTTCSFSRSRRPRGAETVSTNPGRPRSWCCGTATAAKSPAAPTAPEASGLRLGSREDPDPILLYLAGVAVTCAPAPVGPRIRSRQDRHMGHSASFASATRKPYRSTLYLPCRRAEQVHCISALLCPGDAQAAPGGWKVRSVC